MLTDYQLTVEYARLERENAEAQKQARIASLDSIDIDELSQEQARRLVDYIQSGELRPNRHLC